MKTYLRIKIWSLGAEIGRIAREEKKWQHWQFPSKEGERQPILAGLTKHRAELEVELKCARLALAFLRSGVHLTYERIWPKYKFVSLEPLLGKIEANIWKFGSDRYEKGKQVDLQKLQGDMRAWFDNLTLYASHSKRRRQDQAEKRRLKRVAYRNRFYVADPDAQKKLKKQLYGKWMNDPRRLAWEAKRQAQEQLREERLTSMHDRLVPASQRVDSLEPYEKPHKLWG